MSAGIVEPDFIVNFIAHREIHGMIVASVGA
jgi:hypothetical protein